MRSFWVKTDDKNINMEWLVKIKIEKYQQSYPLFEVILILKNKVFERFNEHLPQTFYRNVILNTRNSQIYTLSKNNEELNSTVKLSKYEERNNILKGSTIASPKGVRLKGKFISKM